MTPAATVFPPRPEEGRGGTLPLPAPARWHHWMAIAACLGMFLGAAVFEPATPERPGLSLAGFRLPETCMFLRTTGLPCPGCGLTRSCVAAVHGQFAASLAFHPLGWLVLLYALAQAARHGLWLSRPGWRTTVDRWGGRLDYGLIGLPVLMLALWLPPFLHEIGHRL